MKTNRILITIVLLWLAGVGILLRVWGLEDYYFCPDELMQLTICDHDSLAQVLKGTYQETHPPLTYFIRHFMLKISHGVLFQKSFSIVPGVGLILIFFLLGRALSGTVSGLAMAYMAAFGYGAILQSQVSRQYSLYMFIASLAILFYYFYAGQGRKKHLVIYFVLILLALSTHYSALILALAIGLTWIVSAYLEKKPLDEYKRWFFFHLILFLPFTFYFSLNIWFTFDSGWMSHEASNLLRPSYPETFSELATAVSGLFGYLFYPANTIWTLALTVLGLLALAKSGNRHLAAIIVLAFAINIILAFLVLYPLGGTRHSTHLFPLIAIAIGASLQYAAEAVWSKLQERTSKASVWIQKNQGAVFGVLMAGIIISTLPAAILARAASFERLHYSAYSEFVHTRLDYSNIMDYLDKNLGPDDAVVVDVATSFYIKYLAGPDHLKYPSKSLARVQYNGHGYYYTYFWYYHSVEELSVVMKQLMMHGNLKPNSRIWILNTSGGKEFYKRILSEDAFYSMAAKKEFEIPGGVLFSVGGRAVYQDLLKREQSGG